MTDTDPTITELLAWAKKQPPGPVRSAANILAKQLQLQQELPELDMWGNPLRDGPIHKVILSTFEQLKARIAEAEAKKG